VYAGNPNAPGSQLFDYNADEATVEVNWKEIDPNLARNTAYGTEVPFGGLRVKRIENYNENNTLVLARDYDYKNDNGVESGISNFELDFLQLTPGRNFVNSQSRFPLQTGSGKMISYTAAKEDKVNISTNQKITINSVFESKTVLGDYMGSCFYNNMEGNFLRVSSTLPCFDYPKNGKTLFNNLGDRQEESYEYYITDENTIKPKVVYGIDFDMVFKPKNITDFIAYGTGYPFDSYYYKFQNFDENGDFIKTTTEHLGGQDIVSTTKTFSASTSHHQLTKQTSTSDGVVNETSYAYAHEKGNQLMIDKNMVGIPLETTTTQTVGGSAKTLAKTETVYPTSVPTAQTGNLILPLSVKSYDIPNNTFSTEVTFNKYDEKGNLQQYTTKDGTPVSIVWGYNSTQPIAKVEGITYAQLVSSGLISPIVSASDSDASNPNNEGALLTTLDTFRRSAALQNTKVTTLTYDPLIGVTNIISSQGIRETYKYDSANRLEKVSDQEGKALKDIIYNYKH
jgi:hypothetical protein